MMAGESAPRRLDDHMQGILLRQILMDEVDRIIRLIDEDILHEIFKYFRDVLLSEIVLKFFFDVLRHFLCLSPARVCPQRYLDQTNLTQFNRGNEDILSRISSFSCDRSLEMITGDLNPTPPLR